MNKNNIESCNSSGWIITINNNTNAPITVPKNLDACPNLNPCVYNWTPEQNVSNNGTYVVNAGEQAQFTFQCENPTGSSLIFSGSDPDIGSFTCDFQMNSCTNGAQMMITQAPNTNEDNPVVTISIVGKSINSSFALVGRPIIQTEGLSLSFSDATTFSFEMDLNTTVKPSNIQFNFDNFHFGANLSSGSYPLWSGSTFAGQDITGTLLFSVSSVSGVLTMRDFSNYNLTDPKYLGFQSPVIFGGDAIPYAYIAVFTDSGGKMWIDENYNFNITMPFENSFTQKFTSVSGVFSLGALGTVNFSGTSDNITASATLYANKIAVSNVSVSFDLDDNGYPTGIVITGPMPKTFPSNNQPIEPLQGYYSIMFV